MSMMQINLAPSGTLKNSFGYTKSKYFDMADLSELNLLPVKKKKGSAKHEQNFDIA